MALGTALGLFGGAVSDLFGAQAAGKKADMYKIESQADLLKGKGAELEGEAYDRAKQLALINKDYAAESATIQGVQADRAIMTSIGGARAATAASGLDLGSSFDVLRESAQQGELQKQVIQKQGLIAQEGYQEQADVYGKMVEASGVAVQGAQLASQEHLKAADIEKDAQTAKYFSAGFKGVLGVASLFTGGLGFDPGSAIGDAAIPGNWGEA